MLSQSLGPIALPLAPVVLLFTVWASSWLASCLACRDENKARGELVQLEDARVLGLSKAVRGRPEVVDLWASWCGPCRVEMPVLADAQSMRTSASSKPPRWIAC